MFTCFKNVTLFFIFNNGPVTSGTGKKKRGKGEGSACTSGYKGVQAVRPRSVGGGGRVTCLKNI